MRILITNDDGIASPILPFLANWASRLGEVTVIAPKHEQSGMSHAIIFTRPIEIKKVDMGGIEAYSVDSTPADCVRFAALGLGRKYDIVISGINRGFNLGRDILYSGTAAAIFEAGRMGTRGVAISGDPASFDHAKAMLDNVYDFFKSNELLSINPLYNVNIPNGSSEIRITRQGGVYFEDTFVYRGEDMYELVGDVKQSEDNDLSIDINAVQRHYVSITPLTSDRTALNAYESLRGLCK